jgi:hypothetical protein
MKWGLYDSVNFSIAACLLLQFMQNKRAQVCHNSASHALRKLDQIEYENSATALQHLPLPFDIKSKYICTVDTAQKCETILTNCWSETRIGKYSLFWFTFEKKIFRFFGPFCARSASKLAKSDIMTAKIIFSTNFDMGVKNADLNPLKSCKKFLRKKLLAWKCWNYVPFHLSILCTKVFSPITFFMKNFLLLFQRFWTQNQILRFLIPYWNNIFWVIFALFANFEVKRVRNGLKNLKMYFISVS